MKNLLLSIGLLISVLSTYGQNKYLIDASSVDTDIIEGQLKMGNPGPKRKEILVNNKYLTIAGKTVMPVMGEVHYSRIPREQWEDVILKMKANGITIIATYVLWIHHEEIEGQFEWTGNKDIREFLKLCAKHEIYAYPRIGPWCHAEVRNGGSPDWILTKTCLNDRSNDPVYQHYADRWYQQVAQQLQGLLYKDEGPVIGIQLENEYRIGKKGELHIEWLKATALKHGLDVPLYTVTGWGNASVPQYEVIPLWGAYPDQPWAGSLNRNTNCVDFRFSLYRDNADIGSDISTSKGNSLGYDTYPNFTCEMGVGVMNTEHRRLKINSIDGLGLVLAKLGGGSNMPGYYMFAGGSNPHGVLTTMEEDKYETGYWNQTPVISYDFQGAIRESGKLNKSYHEIKKLHYFLGEFGDRLAPMQSVLATKESELQYALRSDGKSAYLFGLNYCRHNEKPSVKDVQFSIKLMDEMLNVPSMPISIADSSMFIWPVNFKLGDMMLKYATAQPLCHIGNKWVFMEDAVSSPEFLFEGDDIESISSSTGEVRRKNGDYLLSGLNPSKECVVSIESKAGEQQQIVVLNKSEAKQAWLFKGEKEKILFLSNANMYMNVDKLHAYGESNSFKIDKLNERANSEKVFSHFEFSVPEKTLDLKVQEIKPLDGAKCLKTCNVAELNNHNKLLHRFFLKEFNLGNPSRIKRAQLIIASKSKFKLQLNSVWVNSEINPNAVNTIDLTGYVQKGENKLILDFPFALGEGAFEAQLDVEYFNADRISLLSDESWIKKDSYTYPSIFKASSYNGFSAPELVSSIGLSGEFAGAKKRYSLLLPERYSDNLSNVYMQINYTGNDGRIYFNHRLVADDFYNGTAWEVGLNRLSFELANKSLLLELTAMDKDAPVYFDDETAGTKALNATLNNVKLIPEYKLELDVEEGRLKRMGSVCP
ncbi:MAG: beta-galactosidase [Bacteroidales bacterium]